MKVQVEDLETLSNITNMVMIIHRKTLKKMVIIPKKIKPNLTINKI
jgi:hypothetical protein